MPTTLSIVTGVMVFLVTGLEARAMSFAACKERVVDVPAQPLVIIEGHDPSRVRIEREAGNTDATTSGGQATPLDADHARVRLDLEVGEEAYVVGFLGPRCSGRTMRVVADWRGDHSAPPAPTAESSGLDEVQLVWDRERENETWWMRIDVAGSEVDLARGHYVTSYATWITSIPVAPGTSVHLRMVRVLLDGTVSAPWEGAVVRSLANEVRVVTRAPRPPRVPRSHNPRALRQLGQPRAL